MKTSLRLIPFLALLGIAVSAGACGAPPTGTTEQSTVTVGADLAVDPMLAPPSLAGLTHLRRVTTKTGSMVDFWQGSDGDKLLTELGDASHPPSKIQWRGLSFSQAWAALHPGQATPADLVAADAALSRGDAGSPPGTPPARGPSDATNATSAQVRVPGAITVQSILPGDPTRFCSPAWAQANLTPFWDACGGYGAYHWCATNLTTATDYYAYSGGDNVYWDEGGVCDQGDAPYVGIPEAQVSMYRTIGGTVQSPLWGGHWQTWSHAAGTHWYGGNVTYGIRDDLNVQISDIYQFAGVFLE